MIITPELKVKEQKILDIFKRMTWEEQYVVVGYLSEFADRNYANRLRTNQGGVSKVIPFPVAAAM